MGAKMSAVNEAIAEIRKLFENDPTAQIKLEQMRNVFDIYDLVNDIVYVQFRNCFLLADVDKSGTLELQEFERLEFSIKQLYEKKLTIEEMYFNAADVNGDKSLQKEELTRLLQIICNADKLDDAQIKADCYPNDLTLDDLKQLYWDLQDIEGCLLIDLSK